ncbi:Galactose oxidase, central domain [Amycolatopsis xylanica]|uniref:Galactose oxidase, central domain n=1 Tax=Amycolatopsis xylanica TaxID=589385 RepID=A0A1H3RGA1_9PSEU|nr:kelch repeat-containing protein [Amycolatopsis xylanica]SDZ23969.1 Galactose oxidase, central domain [Amycolatopsis xylanica]
MTASTLAATSRWNATDKLPTLGSWHGQHDGAVLLKSKEILVTGGADAAAAPLDRTALFDPATKKWVTAEKLAVARRQHSVTVLDNGDVLVAGGLGSAALSPALTSAAVFLAQDKKWDTKPVPSMNEGRWGHSAVLLDDKRVLIAGGFALRSDDTVRALNSAEIYDPEKRTWTTIEPMLDARAGHAALKFGDGRVLVCCGSTAIGPGAFAPLAYCEIYNPATKKWTATGNLSEPRFLHQAVKLSATTALVVGGGTPGVPGDGTFDAYTKLSVEVFDLNAGKGTWTAKANPLPGGRGRHRAIFLGSGKVLVIGGTAGETGYRGTLVYDSGADSWKPVAGLAEGRWAFAAAALTEAPVTEVLVTGGSTAAGLAAANPPAEDLAAGTEIFTAGSDV